jgi:hypothetical protein
MEKRSRPSKQQVRDWLAQRWEERTPLPNLEQVRFELQQGENMQQNLTRASVRYCIRSVRNAC